MKYKNIFLMLFLCCTSLCFAQDKLFEKYADMDNVTSVFISKKMFEITLLSLHDALPIDRKSVV